MTDIRPMRADDWPDVERIFRQGIDTGDATFESDTPTWQAFDASKLASPRLVADDGGQVVGWIAASPVSARAAYSGVIEHSIYIDETRRVQGVGRRLLEVFVAEADGAGIWTIQSSIFPENIASMRLHESLGFRAVGHREKIARSTRGPRAGQWRDTVLIERRRIDIDV